MPLVLRHLRPPERLHQDHGAAGRLHRDRTTGGRVMVSLVCASVAFTTALSCLILVVTKSRKMRRDIEQRRCELAARRSAQETLRQAQMRMDQNYQGARRNLTIMNDELTRNARRQRGEPVVVTPEEWHAARKKAKDALLGFLNNDQRNMYMLH